MCKEVLKKVRICKKLHPRRLFLCGNVNYTVPHAFCGAYVKRRATQVTCSCQSDDALPPRRFTYLVGNLPNNTQQPITAENCNSCFGSLLLGSGCWWIPPLFPQQGFHHTLWGNVNIVCYPRNQCNMGQRTNTLFMTYNTATINITHTPPGNVQRQEWRGQLFQPESRSQRKRAATSFGTTKCKISTLDAHTISHALLIKCR